MRKTTYALEAKASISLNAAAHREPPAPAAPMAIRAAMLSVTAEAPDAIAPGRVPVIIETKPGTAPPLEDAEALSDEFFSTRVPPERALGIAAAPNVRRVQTKRRKRLTLDHVTPDIRLSASTGGPRVVTETGAGVIVGVIDSGFDLSHPAFRDAAGNLRVRALRVQHEDGSHRDFDTAELEAAWRTGASPGKPGFDDDGHGTHVASIAAGSAFSGLSGVAPDASFVVVKTNFVDTDSAASWIFRRAGNTPCVINMSLGTHLGAHDGTDVEERLHERLTSRAGRAIVISAGNERADPIHIGGRFHDGQTREVVFDLLEQDDEPPGVTLTLWYASTDRFELELITPSGEIHPLPAIDQGETLRSTKVVIDLARKRHRLSSSIHAQIDISFRATARIRRADLRGWRVRMTCRRATIGRLDGWFMDAGYAEFRDHELVEDSRTIALAATGEGCIAVASHIARNRWAADAGAQRDRRAVIGRHSPFSSAGPTRDGRQKPDLSAPGQYVTAALADLSESADDDLRAEAASRVLTIEGTSMAAPVVSGVVALLFQKKPGATFAEIRDALRRSARRDAHTGPASWDPVYGFGKIDVQRALALI